MAAAPAEVEVPKKKGKLLVIVIAVLAVVLVGGGVGAFELVGLSKADVEERFGGLYRAFQYGAPPHGGMAAGVDRIVMLVCGAQNLREVTLFPMNQRAEDLLMGAPSPAEPRQLRELSIRVVEPAKGQ